MNPSPVSLPRLGLIVASCLALSVLFFAPRLWLMRAPVPGSFQWERAESFLRQCEQPFRSDVEPAMRWRLLPPLVCHLLHLPGRTPLALPWLGVIAATGYTAVLFRRRLDDWRFVAGGTLLFATTSAVLVPVGWLGMNDAWVWLGLLAVAFRRGAWALPLAALLCPWIDERFIIGFPLAWLVGRLERGSTEGGAGLRSALWLVPYAVIRLGVTVGQPAGGGFEMRFLASNFDSISRLLPLVPLGWWMGLRAAWLPLAYAGWTLPARGRVVGAAVLIFTLGIGVVVASDTSRSVAILMPAVLLGCFVFARRAPKWAASTLLTLGAANLVIPAAHVVFVHIDPINPLPIEVIRWLRPS